MHSHLLNPTTMQKFCTLLNETQICWTQQRCRNSALYWRDSNLLNPRPTTMQKFCTLSNETEICWTQQRCRNSALHWTRLKICWTQQRSIVKLEQHQWCRNSAPCSVAKHTQVNWTQRCRNSALCLMANYIIIQFYWAEKNPKNSQIVLS